MRSPVPTGTVDFVTTTVPGFNTLRKLADRIEHEGQIGVPVASARRRSNSNEHSFCILNGVRQDSS